MINVEGLTRDEFISSNMMNIEAIDEACELFKVSTREEMLGKLYDHYKAESEDNVFQDIYINEKFDVSEKVKEFFEHIQSSFCIITEDSKAGFTALKTGLNILPVYSAKEVVGTGGIDAIMQIAVAGWLLKPKLKILFIVDALSLTGTLSAQNIYANICSICGFSINMSVVQYYLSFEYEALVKIATTFPRLITNKGIVDELVGFYEKRSAIYHISFNSFKVILACSLKGVVKCFRFSITKSNIGACWSTSCDSNNPRCNNCQKKSLVTSDKYSRVFSDMFNSFIEGWVSDAKSTTA